MSGILLNEAVGSGELHKRCASLSLSQITDGDFQQVICHVISGKGPNKSLIKGMMAISPVPQSSFCFVFLQFSNHLKYHNTSRLIS